MALFPAFSGSGDGERLGGTQQGELDWLSNSSFRTEDALTLQHRALEANSICASKSPHTSTSEVEDRGDGEIESRKLKRKKKKKKKKHRSDKKEPKNSRAGSDSEGLESPPKTHGGWSRGDGWEEEKSRSVEEPPSIQAHFVWLEDSNMATEEPFCIDKKPDRANWEYKSLYRGDIARFLSNFTLQTFKLQASTVPPLDELMKVPGLYYSDSEKRKVPLKVTLEKKLAILDRALQSNPDSMELKLARLGLLKEFWEPAALLKEWQKVVFLHPNQTELWHKYLLFCQSQFSTFSVSKIQATYGKCLSTLAAVHDGTMVSHPALPATEEAMLVIFLQQCHFLKQTGHSEKVITLFQTLLNFTFFKPDSVTDLTTRQQVEFLEPFWDSGEPRFGEAGARGWKAWMRQQERGGWISINQPDEEEEDIDDDTSVKDKSRPKCQIWLELERSREAEQWLPWRPDKTKGQTEEDCEDPERQVLFDDVGQSMFKISSPHLKFQLMTSFLHFLGVPSGGAVPAPCLFLALDEASLFESGLLSESPLTSLDAPPSGVSCVGRTGRLGGGRQLIGCCMEGEKFIQNVFHQSLPLFLGDEKSHLSLCWLQYEKLKVRQCLLAHKKKKLKSQGKRSRKLAKSLLKESENRNSLALWQEYAHLEWLLGNLDDSRKVFDTAITVAAVLGLENAKLCSLCLLYSQLEVELSRAAAGGTMSRAVYILTKLAEGGTYAAFSGQVSPVGILKARKAYERAFSGCFGESVGCGQSGGAALRPSRTVVLTGCFVLFQYLTVGIEAADAVYRQAFEKLKALCLPEDTSPKESIWMQSMTSDLEMLSVMHAMLLRYHMQTATYPLRPIREILTETLRQYPGNQSLWRLYVQLENKSHSASKARKFLDNISRSSRNFLPRLVSIHMEQRRKELVESVQRIDQEELHSTLPETGLTNRIQALFEHAVQSESGARCPLLWRMYLRFSVSRGNKERSRGVFYKALQDCPWLKVLYMDAVEYFPEQFQEILDLMTEKELRVRVPVEELEILLED
nr:PREDICTED: protein NRDE2 homolog [Latimeria chalumnae]|eukprot:XP_014341970.1 PREDICTED: protein NRDE2 homolog [Latimeria chalumnae]